MKWLKRILIVLVALVALFLVVIGPWPVYKDSNFAKSGYYKQAMADIERNAALSDISANPMPLKAGWAVRDMTPPVGTPMGGYGARPDGKKSKGVRDRLHAKAIVFSDGKDIVALVGSDMLLVPPNIAEMTCKQVALAGVPLTANNILFTASHTHCGPGGFGPGVAAKVSAGTYDPKVPELVSKAFAQAIIEAHNTMKPAKLATGSADAPEYIRNRTRNADTDPLLQFMVVEKEDGGRCIVSRFSAHPTNFGSRMVDFSAEYPGELQKALEEQTGATAIYLGGAVGSMGPRAPEAPTADEKIVLMGQALAKRVIENMGTLEFRDTLDIASVGVPVGMPGMQMRPLSPKWRISPVGAKLFGVPSEGWIQGVRIGDIQFLGLPFDFSGEVAKVWREEQAKNGLNLWVHGFCVTYCGYLSPDRYYYELDDKGALDYETGLMGWFGPNTEAYFKALSDQVIAKLGGAAKTNVAAAR